MWELSYFSNDFHRGHKGVSFIYPCCNTSEILFWMPKNLMSSRSNGRTHWSHSLWDHSKNHVWDLHNQNTSLVPSPHYTHPCALSWKWIWCVTLDTFLSQQQILALLFQTPALMATTALPWHLKSQILSAWPCMRFDLFMCCQELFDSEMHNHFSHVVRAYMWNQLVYSEVMPNHLQLKPVLYTWPQPVVKIEPCGLHRDHHLGTHSKMANSGYKNSIIIFGGTRLGNLHMGTLRSLGAIYTHQVHACVYQTKPTSRAGIVFVVSTVIQNGWNVFVQQNPYIKSAS